MDDHPPPHRPRRPGGQAGTAEHLRILQTISPALAQSTDLEELLALALGTLTQVTGHEISSLHLLAPDGTALHLRGDRGLSPELREINRTLPIGQGLIGRVAATGEPLHLADVTTAPNLFDAARPVVEHEGIRSQGALYPGGARAR